MASYLDRLITLDEEGTENLDTSFEAEQTQDITEVIDVDTNNDEINAEAVSIEEDLEAMQDGTEAVGELAEQESVNDELLESPGDISPEVAKATNDAFKVTLAGLAIDVRDTVYGNITYDSNRNEPIEVVRITNDGVKDFMSKIKEHIIAFFRTIKAKLQKLIAKLFIMFSDVSKKGEALHKQLKNKLDRLKNKTTSAGNAKIDTSRHETKQKIMEYMPLWFLEHDGSINNAIKALEDRFTKESTEPYSMEICKAGVGYMLMCTMSSISDSATKHLTTVLGNIGNGLKIETDPNKVIKVINGLIDKKQGGFFNNTEYLIEAPEKKNYETSNAVIAGGLFSKTVQCYSFRLHEDADELIPSIVWSNSKVKQSRIDSVSIKDVTPDDIKSLINCAIKIGKNSKGMCNAGYGHLADGEKFIIRVFDELSKIEEIKSGVAIRASSVWRSLLASTAFKAIMDQAKAGRRVLALANYLYNQLDEDYKDAKKEDKRK